jgi:hypothetical protein
MRLADLLRGRLASLMAILTLCTSIVVVGCSESSRAASTQQGVAEQLEAIDACALLTAEEIEQATGKAPGAPEPKKVGDIVPSCRWPAADGSSTQIVHVLVGRTGPATYEAFLENMKEQLEEGFSADDYEKLDIGNYGVWWKDVNVQVYTSDYMIVVTNSEMPPADRDVCIQLAKKAMARLP